MKPSVPVLPHPYANRDLAVLPGEIWRPVAGFEDAYEASSCGRVRSLGRFYPHRQGIPVWLTPRIMAQTYRLDKNERTGLSSVAVRAAFCRDGVRCELSTGTVLAEFASSAEAVRFTGWDGKSIITAA